MDVKISEEVTPPAPKKVVGTQIPLTLYERLKTDAEKDFMSISDLLRKIIFMYYKDMKGNNDD